MNRALPAVRLRVPTHEDAFVWHRIFDDPDVMEFHGGRSAELSVYEELTARQRRHDAELGFCLWTMTDEAGRVIGFTGGQPWPREWGPRGEIEIGWRLAREYWGKGYATAAALITAAAAASLGPCARRITLTFVACLSSPRRLATALASCSRSRAISPDTCSGVRGGVAISS